MVGGVVGDDVVDWCVDGEVTSSCLDVGVVSMVAWCVGSKVSSRCSDAQA